MFPKDLLIVEANKSGYIAPVMLLLSYAAFKVIEDFKRQAIPIEESNVSKYVNLGIEIDVPLKDIDHYNLNKDHIPQYLSNVRGQIEEKTSSARMDLKAIVTGLFNILTYTNTAKNMGLTSQEIMVIIQGTALQLLRKGNGYKLSKIKLLDPKASAVIPIEILRWYKTF